MVRICPWRGQAWLMLVVLVLVAGCGASSTVTPRPTAFTPLPALAGADWPTYHRDALRTGNVAGAPDPQGLYPAWRVSLDGAVYAEPLVVGGRVIVATENDTVFALDPQTGELRWQTHLGTPVAQSDLPCGNIFPLGITGTPVYDSASGLVFVVAEVAGPSHVLVGLEAATGQVRVRRPIDPPGMTAPRAQQQRAALALSNGWVYVAFGGLDGDCGPYLGWVVGSATDGQGDLRTFHVATTREGGIWAPGGIVMAPNGDLLVAVGNGAATGGGWDESDAVLRLSPQLQLVDSFAPTDWAEDNARDADLGSLNPVLLADGSILAVGKSGQGYLLDGQHLGGIGGQVATSTLCQAYGGSATSGTQAFIPCADGLRAVTVANGQIIPQWRARAAISGSPVIGGQTVYSLNPGGTLYALDRATGNVRASVGVAPTSRFATPTLDDRAIFIGTLTGIEAIGMR